MFLITSTHALTWPNVGDGKRFSLKKGENKLADESKVPTLARAKLLRFLERGVLKFDVPKSWDYKAPVKEAAEDDDEEGGGGDSFDPATVDLTAESLGKLKFDQLQLVAAELEVDVTGLKKKTDIIAAILNEANGDSTPSA